MSNCVYNWTGNVLSRTLTNSQNAFNTVGGGVGTGLGTYVSLTNEYFSRTILAPTYAIKTLYQLRGLQAGGLGYVAGGDFSPGATINATIGGAVGIAAGAGLLAAAGIGSAGLASAAAGAAASIFIGAAAQAVYEEIVDGSGTPTFDCRDPDNPNNPDKPYNPNPFDPNQPYDPSQPYGPNNPYDPSRPPDPKNPYDPRNPHDPDDPRDPRNRRPQWPGSPLNPPNRDPLVLDLNGDGIQLTSLSGSNAQFDLDGDGFRERTGWISAEDGFLVRDANDNGLVDGVGELFGNAGEDGFVALARIDSDADGIINSNDDAFAELRVWQDGNGDGISQTGELKSLSQAGVSAIRLDSIASGTIVADNIIARTGSYIRSDGSDGMTASAYFAVDTVITAFTPPPGYEESDFASIAPRLKGYGAVTDFSYALSTNPALAQATSAFLTETASLTGAQLRASFEQLVMLWTGIPANVADRGPHIDAAHLAVVEAFYGTTFEQQIGGQIYNDPDAVNAPAIEKAYQAIIESYLTQFSSQAAVARYLYTDGAVSITEDKDLILSALLYDPVAGRLIGDPTLVIKTVGLLAPADGADAYKYFDRRTTELAGIKNAFYANSASGLTTVWETALQGLSDRAAASALLERTVGDTWTKGTQTSDQVYGGDAADVLVGSGGDDYQEGGSGSDMYRYASGDGSDRINDVGGTTNVDVLKLTDLDVAGVSLRRDGIHMYVKDLSTGAEIQIDNQFYSDETYGIEQLTFADGTVWDRAAIQQAAWIRGDANDNQLYGSNLTETFVGNAGNDYQEGGNGSDVYRYASGDGADSIYENGATSDVDTLHLTNLNSGDVSLRRDDVHLFVLDLATGQETRINNQFYSDEQYGLEQMVFADGTIWDRARIQKEAWIRGDSNGNNLYGSYQSETLVGAGGDDNIEGGNGSDVYRYASGDGADSIYENGATTDVDKLILTDLNAGGISLRRDGSHLFVLDLATDQETRINNQFYSDEQYGLEQIVFADGTVWDRERIRQEAWIRGDDGGNSLYGSDLSETFVGGGGNDNFEGGSGSDVYRYASGDGADSIYENGATTDVDKLLLTDLNAGGISLRRDGSHLFMLDLATDKETRINNQFYSDEQYGLEQIVFADGTIWDRERIRQEAWIRGDSGGNSLYGSDQSETFVGGGGNDNFEGGNGSDVYRYASGDGSDSIYENGATSDVDILHLTNLSSGDVSLRRDDIHLFVLDLATGQETRINNQFYSDEQYGLEQIVFVDGTIWDRARIQQEAWIRGDGNGNNLYGSDQSETLVGGGGNDNLEGSSGSDVYRYASGDGADSIYENGATTDIDKLLLTNLNADDISLRRDDIHLYMLDLATGHETRISNQFYTDEQYSLEQIVFADGTVWDRARIQQEAWLRGDGSGSNIYGSNQAETLVGNGGDDYLAGGSGSDVYRYASGDGNDRIYEDGSATDVDTLLLTNLNAGDISLRRDDIHLWMLDLTTGQETRIDNQFYTDEQYSLEQIVFADGEIWDRATIASMAEGNFAPQSRYASATTSGSSMPSWKLPEGHDLERSPRYSVKPSPAKWHSSPAPHKVAVAGQAQQMVDAISVFDKKVAFNVDRALENNVHQKMFEIAGPAQERANFIS